MKPTLRFSTFLLGFCLVATLQAQDAKLNLAGTGSQPAAQPAKPAEPQFTEQQLLEMYGWYLGKQAGLSELGFTSAQTDLIVQGLQLAGNSGSAPFDPQKIGPALRDYMHQKQEGYLAKLKVKNATESASYFEKLKENKNVIVLTDGLCYEITQPGTGDYPKPTQVVKVNYTGKLIDGTVFDSTERHTPPGPIEFGLDQVIPGWTEGIQKINKGGKIRLYIPSNLAYGDQPQSGIPPGSTLIFDVELIDIKDASAAAAPAPVDNTPK